MQKTFYEQHRDAGNIMAMKTKSVVYPVHFHMSPELFILKKGSCTVLSNGKTYNMTDGCVAFFSPYDTHAYLTEDLPQDDPPNIIVVIPPFFWNACTTLSNNDSPVKAVVHDPELCDNLARIVSEYFLKSNIPQNVLQASINLLFAYIANAFVFEQRKKSCEQTLIQSMLSYISDHYREKISLQSISSAIGYTPAYLSRVFNAYFGMSVSDHINKLRLNYIEEMRKLNPNAKTINLIYDSGFGGIQTYYRNKAKNTNFLLTRSFNFFPDGYTTYFTNKIRKSKSRRCGSFLI